MFNYNIYNYKLLLSKNEVVALFATCVWLIWFAQNMVEHEGACSNESLIANQAL